MLKTEKEKEEQRHEEEIGETAEKHAKELQDLESNNNQKLMIEYEKYQELQVKHLFYLQSEIMLGWGVSDRAFPVLHMLSGCQYFVCNVVSAFDFDVLIRF